MKNQCVLTNTDGLYIGLPHKIKCAKCGKVWITNQSPRFQYNSENPVYCDGLYSGDDAWGEEFTDEVCGEIIWAAVDLRSNK